ncbi:hypothetical protein A3Q37_03014 [Streptomyces sp. PTY087I2]|nr:hypothetical protein A3Q37_03014 [Streptomyces sp. PTY087I2]
MVPMTERRLAATAAAASLASLALSAPDRGRRGPVGQQSTVLR